MLFFKKKALKHTQISQKEKARQADELYRLGVTCYREFDPKWKDNLTKSAELGSDRAMRYLGKIYEQRLEYPESALWYEKAFSLGNGDAAADLGKLYLKSWDGSGNSQDPKKAEEYLALAAESGNEQAAELLESLKEKYNNPNAVSKEKAQAVEAFALNVIRNGYSRYNTSDEDKKLIDTVIMWLQDPMQINFTCPNKTAALLNFRLMREDMGASYFDRMLQLKYEPVYELLLAITLLFESHLDTQQILSRLNNVISYYTDFPEKAQEQPDFFAISKKLYDAVKINEYRLGDEMLHEKAMSKILEALEPLYGKLEYILSM